MHPSAHFLQGGRSRQGNGRRIGWPQTTGETLKGSVMGLHFLAGEQELWLGQPELERYPLVAETFSGDAFQSGLGHRLFEAVGLFRPGNFLDVEESFLEGFWQERWGFEQAC